MQPFSFEGLPKGWQWTAIGEIADAVRGVAFPSGETSAEPFENSIACLTTSGVQDEVNWRSRRFIPRKCLSNEKQILKNGDLLVSTANSKELVGKSCLIKNPKFPCTFGAFVTVLRPNAKVDSSLFAYWLRSPEVLRWCFQNSSNTTNISNLRTSELLSLELPLPKPDEQKRIAATLDRADRLRRQRRFAQTLSDSFLQSVFIKMFGGGRLFPFVNANAENSINVNNWKWAKLTDVAKLKTGHTPSRNLLEYWGGDIPWITLTDIRELDGTVALKTSEYTNELGIKNSAAVLLPEKTVCLSRTASVGFVTVMGREMATSQDFVNWICGKELNPVYLMWALIFSRSYIKSLSSGTTHKTIYFPTVEEFRALIPPLPLQEKFAAIVQKFERVRRQQREATRQAEHLFQTLLHRAFRGEL
jgi:type I restriction enzyme, S subunit